MLNSRPSELESSGEGPGHLCVEKPLQVVLTCDFRAGDHTDLDF